MVGRTLVVVHGARHPTDADWMIYLEALRQNVATLEAQLIVTDGGSPTTAQRRASLELAGDQWERLPPTAVVTSSVLARGAVTALSWFMKIAFALSRRPISTRPATSSGGARTRERCVRWQRAFARY